MILRNKQVPKSWKNIIMSLQIISLAKEFYYILQYLNEHIISDYKKKKKL